MSPIDHGDSDFINRYLKMFDHLLNGRAFFKDEILNLKTIISEEGKKFNGNIHLKVPEAVDLFVFKIPYNIVGWQFFSAEKLW